MSDPESHSVSETNKSPVSVNWSPKLLPSLVACVAGGLLGFAIIHAVDPLFKFADLPELGISPPPELVAKYNAAQIAFWTKNYAFDFGLIGLCIGAAFGLIATRRRRIPSGLAGGLGGVLGGSVAGYLLGILVAKALLASADQSIVQSTYLHFAAWASMCAAILFMVGWVQDGLIRAMGYLLVGIVVGLAVAVVHNISSSMIFANANLLKLIPESFPERVAWILTCTIVLGLGLHFALPRKRSSELIPRDL